MSSTQNQPPAIVTLPAEIDTGNREQAYDQLCAACSSGAPVVIADFTGTRFCDAGSMRRLLDVQDRAAGRTIQLRFAIVPGHPVRRIAELLDPRRRVRVYDSPAEAAVTAPGAGG